MKSTHMYAAQIRSIFRWFTDHRLRCWSNQLFKISYLKLSIPWRSPVSVPILGELGSYYFHTYKKTVNKLKSSVDSHSWHHLPQAEAARAIHWQEHLNGTSDELLEAKTTGAAISVGSQTFLGLFQRRHQVLGVKIQKSCPLGFCKGRGKLIIVKSPQRVLHNKCLLYRGKYFTRAIFQPKKDTFPTLFSRLRKWYR